MKFTEFLSENLDRRRGFQTELADHLEVAKSTITAWRQGATPDFASCLKLADYFGLDPLDIFEMLEDSNYISVYLRFFAAERKREEESGGAESGVQPRDGLCENDLYSDRVHAGLHRDLQALLEAATPEAQAIATVIRMAARQLRSEQPEDAEDPVRARMASVYQSLRVENEKRGPDKERKRKVLPAARLRTQES